MNKTFA